MDPHAALQYRAWHRAPESIGGPTKSPRPLAWQFSGLGEKLLVLVDTQPSALRALVKQLPPQSWSALVLPGATPVHPEFSLFLAQLGKPPIIGRETATRTGL